LIFNGEALAILKRLEAIRQTERQPLRQAARKVIEELEGKRGGTVREGRVSSELVEVLKEEIRRLERENEWLRGRVEDLTRLALPRPRRWLPWRRSR